MNEFCPLISDRMPDVLAGRDGWSEDDRDHLNSCAECAGEWRLIKSAAALGSAASSRIDPEAVAHAVTQRLDPATVGGRNPALRRIAAMGLAAAAVIALAVGLPRLNRTGGGEVDVAARYLPQLDSLDSGELSAVFQSLAESVGEEQLLPNETTGLTDLSDVELEQILQSWEG